MSSELHKNAEASSEEDFANEIEPNSFGHTIATLLVIVIPFLGVIAAVILTWHDWFFMTDLFLLAALYAFTGFGITVGFHRLLTHRSFETYDWVRRFFTIAGSMAIEGTPTSWVADHRRHHTHSDQPGDPHSPYVGYEDSGFVTALKGFWHAQVGWLITEGGAKPERFVPDMLKDKAVMGVDKYFFKFYLPLSFGLPAVAGYLLTGLSWKGALTGFVWGGLVRIFLLHHVTWSVNSICHMFGTRDWKTTDQSRNNWLLALPTLGEAWHHNHHAFPTAAFHGLKRWQKALDPSGWVVKLLEITGLAWNVKRVTQEQMDNKSVTAG